MGIIRYFSSAYLVQLVIAAMTTLPWPISTLPRDVVALKRWSRTDRSAKEFRDIGLKDRKLSD
jgi:hypothetical protein